MKNPLKAPPRICSIAIFAAFALALAALSGAGSARAAALSVTTLNDSGAGSLRQVIADAAAGDTITFKVHGTITLTSGALMIGKSLAIQGPGSNHLKISGNHAGRVFVIVSPVPSSPPIVIISRMTISHGLAVADAGTPPTIKAVFDSVGGGILNFGNLTLSDVDLSNNQALGDANKMPLGQGRPGAAYGGGVANGGTLSINSSLFIGNVARGADDSNGPIAGLGGGGAMFNYGNAEVTGSWFTRNQAIGGNDCSSPILSGHGAGGAIISGGLNGVLSVKNSIFDHNQAIGGNGGQVTTTPVPIAVGPDKASGGAIDVTGGSGTIDHSLFNHNQSIGGIGAPGGSGGVGAGGAIVATNLANQGTNATIIDSRVEHNAALGGAGGVGGDGGEAEGGGLTSTSGAILTVISTTVAYNRAQGGEGDEGHNGGNGLGGGFYDYTASTLVLQGAIVIYNKALGGEAEEHGRDGHHTGDDEWGKPGDGSDGQGIGGGVYYLGTYSADTATVIKKNKASTSNDNVWP
jgi:hypothetical protein